MEDIIKAIEKPLIFASKNNFSSFHAIKDLDRLVCRLAEAALDKSSQTQCQELFLDIKNSFRSFSSFQVQEKKNLILRTLNDLEKIRELIHCEGNKKTDTVHLNQNTQKLKASIQYVKGVGPRLSEVFFRKGIQTVEDALYFLPRTYLDRRNIKKISSITPGEYATVAGRIVATGLSSTAAGKKIIEIAIDDGTQVLVAKWFHYTSRYLNILKRRFQQGQKVILSGRTADFRFQKEMHHPDIEVMTKDDHLNRDFQKIIPVYSLTEGVHQKTIRKVISNIVQNYAHTVPDPLPESIRRKQKLITVREALTKVHLPSNNDNYQSLINFQSPYHKRLVFDEFFFLELGLAMRKKGVSIQPGISFTLDSDKLLDFYHTLPFNLTAAQKRVLKQIFTDMKRPYPMNRLLQGDVGSGKTVIALIASLVAVWNGFQGVFMAPTEILAEQHFTTILSLTKNLNLSIVLLTSSQSKSQREKILESIRKGEANLVVGTHALIQESVDFFRLGFVVVDEQHKFGVMQRAQLKKKGKNPDILVMTATPIPRTLGLTVYGDLDISIVDELPPGRKPVKTKVFYENTRAEVYRLALQELKKGRQIFVVYPLVEESEKVDLKNATQMAHHLQKDIFPDYQVGLIHGKLSTSEKDTIMEKFHAGDIHVLVATTVIEVGIDIPNASLIIIEHAERFGLSQLHQLRGRVGRGSSNATCILLAQYKKSDDARRRLAVMERTNDGFKIAEEDFAIRGPGEFLGTRQSGLPDFRVANVMRDINVLQQARQEAFELLERDPELSSRENQHLKKVLIERWKGKLELAGVG